MHQTDTYTILYVQIAKDVKQLTLAQAQMTQSIMCDFCAGRYPTYECHQEPLEEEGSQDEKSGSQKVVRKSNKIQKGNDTSELEVQSKYMHAFPFPQNMGRSLKSKKLEETLVVKLNAHGSIILQNKLLQKCGDIESFTISCEIRIVKFENSLCNSGASINLLPLSIFKKLEGELKIIKFILVSLQLADQSTIISKGIIEDVLVRVDKFVFLVDFIMVDMKENNEIVTTLSKNINQ
ncbi:hypothetical protein R3W88_011614 [Solanum pinnatisectum]|uniref:Uncharacterized protein n=1 Tax=Solanum pinnatisectum TaxID=50273 RepID=A0AAV9L738_9SOLN|nr:hypothetical protein R3W88_011614 [Solanum pinnatisectum]